MTVVSLVAWILVVVSVVIVVVVGAYLASLLVELVGSIGIAR